MRSSDFMRAVPAAARAKLPAELQGFKTAVRPWLVQLYFGSEARIHYEVWLLAPRAGHGANVREVEIGLHFESREAGENQRLLELCYQHLFEIKAELGAQVEAEPWSRGWTKCYEVLEVSPDLSEEFLDRVAGRVAQFVQVLQPLLAPSRQTPKKQPARRRR